MTKLSNLIKTLVVTPRFYEVVAFIIVVLAVITTITTFLVNAQYLWHEINSTLETYPKGDAKYSTDPLGDIVQSSTQIIFVITRVMWQSSYSAIGSITPAIVGVAVCVFMGKFLRTRKRP